jgi:hypothetical protein
MLQEKELNSRSAGFYAYAAARDARIRAVAMWSTYTPAEQVRAERAKLGLELCYSAKGIHVNPRKKFIAIKVDNPTVRDRRNLALLEQDYAMQGITKVVTEQGVTYRIPRI